MLSSSPPFFEHISDGNQLPKVSCVLLTFNRFEQFCKSFQCFCDQTYPHKELFILSHGTNEYRNAVRGHVALSGRNDVNVLYPSSRLPLGALRNIAIEACSGDVVCQWDDDDFSAPGRIAAQLSAMQLFAADASILLDNLHLFYDSRQVFWCDWRRSRQDLGLPGSLMVDRRKVLAYRPELSSNEDSQLLIDLCRNGRRLALVGGMAHLYIYTYHGSNTFGRPHHQHLTRHLGLERGTLQGRLQTICRTLERHAIEPPIDIVDHMEDVVWRWDGVIPTSPSSGSTGEAASVHIVSRAHVGADSESTDVPERAMRRRCSELGLAVESHSMVKDLATDNFHAVVTTQRTGRLDNLSLATRSN